MAAWLLSFPRRGRAGVEPRSPANKPHAGTTGSPGQPGEDSRKGYKPEKKSHSSFMLSTITVMAISTASPVTQ